jgi:hypothetical protein
MGRGGQDSDFKTHLVTEICSISTRSVACIHRHGFGALKSRFIDWYRVLGVRFRVLDLHHNILLSSLLGLLLNLIYIYIYISWIL